MRQLDIKEYVKNEKDRLKTFAQERGLNNRIKLGIIDATREDDIGNQIYIKRKVEDFAEMGWKAQVYKVPDSAGGVRPTIDWAIDGNCTAIIVQLPVRPGEVFYPEMIPQYLDCDGIRHDSFVRPATPGGIIDYLKACGVPMEGRNALVLGRGMVGKPMADMLLEENMTVSIAHSHSDPSAVSGLMQDADLIVSAVGKPKFFCRNQCASAIVIDVGINRGEDGKICGDFEEGNETVAWSTPVPGGVGLLTRLKLLKNCVELNLY